MTATSRTINGSIAFVIIGTTFLTYLFNIFALTQLKASSVGAFVYMQPLVGILFALFLGKDQLTLVKVAAMAFVLVGVMGHEGREHNEMSDLRGKRIHLAKHFCRKCMRHPK